ncbi:hypothetical protein ACE6H2_003331 [Prunus campanulata]
MKVSSTQNVTNLLSISHCTFHDYDYENTKQFSGNNLTNIVYFSYNKEKNKCEKLVKWLGKM